MWQNVSNPRPAANQNENLIALVSEKLSPIAIKYGYSDTSLGQLIKWKPIVLLLGNFSSGKSSLVNDLLGVEVQETGQAPTDDSFTVITHKPGIASWENIEGTAVINDHGLPFHHLSKYGQRLTAHFRMKKVDVPMLEDFAIIDTPGMLDSVSENDRGYDYQSVVADLAVIADLIIVFFDPHRPGTVRETHELLKRTLPTASYENRTLFVLNRVDECENLSDLLRTYGTLCWNLSQMTGRKDIPKIFLSYREPSTATGPVSRDFLGMLVNQRSEVKNLIRNAPKHRWEHMVSYSEAHGRHLHYFLKIIEKYGVERRKVTARAFLIGLVSGLAFGSLFWLLWLFGLLPGLDADIAMTAAVVIGVFWGILGMIVARRVFMKRFRTNIESKLVNLATLDKQSHEDSWVKVKDDVSRFLKERGGRFSLLGVKHDARKVRQFLDRVNQEARRSETHA